MPKQYRVYSSHLARAIATLGPTQREIAGVLGVSPRSVQNYLSGVIVPKKLFKRFPRLERAYKRDQRESGKAASVS